MLFALLDHWRAPAPEPSKTEWMGFWRYAHRGLHKARTPENSPSAFAAAMRKGMGIECDIQRSSDGQPIVFHDADLDRLTRETGPVALRSAEALGRIALSGSKDSIPTLRQVLAQVAGRVPILIEIKSSRGDGRRVGTICLAVRRELEGYTGRHAVMSFDPRVVRWFADFSPLTVRGLVMTEEKDNALFGPLRRRLWLWKARPDFLAYDVRDLPSRFAAAQRRRGLPVLTWTVSSPELAEQAWPCADALIVEGAGVA